MSEARWVSPLDSHNRAGINPSNWVYILIYLCLSPAALNPIKIRACVLHQSNFGNPLTLQGDGGSRALFTKYKGDGTSVAVLHLYDSFHQKCSKLGTYTTQDLKNNFYFRGFSISSGHRWKRLQMWKVIVVIILCLWLSALLRLESKLIVPACRDTSALLPDQSKAFRPNLW
jgi:hypothetical protein